MNRRSFISTSGALGLSATLLPHAAGAAGLAQVSAVQRFRVGDFSVTTISDGYLDLVADLFPTVDQGNFDAALEQAFLRPGAYQAAVNVFVLDDGKDVHLIDAGGGPMAPTVGQIETHLSAAGYGADQIKTLIMTHLHPDHVGGAVKDGVPRFANAEMVVHGADLGFWTDAAIKAQVPDDVQVFFDMATAAVTTYGDRVRQFDSETEIVPGLRAMPLPGHTPGHTGYVLSSGDETLMIWGDIVHAAPVQLPNPSASIAFDIDGAAAVATRARVLDMVATDRLMIAGTHMPFPGVGHIVKSGDGYGFEPASWQYLMRDT